MYQSVTLERVRNYWAANLPSRRGQFNFDQIRIDCYRDANVAFEAFKAGEYDFRQESSAANWAKGYNGKLFDEGLIIKKQIPDYTAQPMQALTFNIQRPVFQDRRVREALNYFLDFQWLNKNLFYGQYRRVRSYFQNTEYEARGLPSPAEVAILEPIRTEIPPEVFTEEYNPPVTDGTGYIRPQARKAIALLKEAGWELKHGKMLNAKTGKQMRFELMIYDSSSERIAGPLQNNLARFGIKMDIRMVDVSQYINRLRSRDFDMIAQGFDANPYPSASTLQDVWDSKYIDSTWNTAGVADPAVDYLIDGIRKHGSDKQALLAWGPALDRVLTWNFYVIPEWYLGAFRIAYANKFGQPKVSPKYDVGLDTWWAN
jgi:microcin C transport system substrate-binding protein